MHGAGADDPLVWYGGAAVSEAARQHLFTDHQGSVTATASSSGALSAVNSYDVWGIPGALNMGRFQYTGQAYIPELGMYHYKARIYAPTLGRFLQTDPVGYQYQVNLYAYVGNDPTDGRDPSGEETADRPPPPPTECQRQSAVCSGASFIQGTPGSPSDAGAKRVPENAQPQGACSECMLMALFPVTRIINLAIKVGDWLFPKPTTTVIGRVNDLKNLRSGEQSLLQRLPDRGSPQANWSQNSGVLRQEMSRGVPIRDASPGNTGGQFLNAERNLLRSRGLTYDASSSYWVPPGL